MISYITRIQRWWTLLKSLDPSIEISDEMRGDMMLDNAGQTETQKLLILTSTANATNQVKLIEALKKQHSKIHYRSLAPTRPNPGRYTHKGGKSKGDQSRWKRTANLADDW